MISFPYDFSMSLVLGLLKTVNSHDLVLVVVDVFYQVTHIISCLNANNVSHLVRLLIRKIMQLYGLPNIIMLVEMLHL